MTTQPATIPSPTANELVAEARRNAANARRFADRAIAQSAAQQERAAQYPADIFMSAIATALSDCAQRAAKYAQLAQDNATNAAAYTHTPYTNPAAVECANAAAIRNTATAATVSDIANDLASIAHRYARS